MDEWSSSARQNAAAALAEEIPKQAGASIRVFPADQSTEEAASNLRETKALFRAVSVSVINHTYSPGPAYFQDKIDHFDYSLGKEVQGLKTEEADALLIVWGMDSAFTSGAIAKQVAIGIVGALFGVIPVQRKVTFMSAALIDPDSGNLLWFKSVNSSAAQTSYDLRDRESAARMVRAILQGFQIQK